MLYCADLQNGKYRNPILFCDYSDPDVIRVGNTYYLTASSFNFTPGLPILASHDLVNWTLINYAAENIPLPQYDTPQHAKGLWAPSIRYHGGMFYIFVATPDEGIFVTETDDPAGKWTPLCAIWKGKGFIDPCPFWDDDGKVYVIHAHAKSRIGFKSKLGILEADPKTFACTASDTFIFDGTETQPTIEGPKVYKRGDLYYILAPAGGVKQGWQTALRSKSIYGPFEEKIVMAQGSSPVNGPHQGALVDTSSGEEWFIHFQDRGVYGRITHLQPVAWKDGWPFMGTSVKNGSLPGEPVAEYQMPLNKSGQETFKISANAVRAGKNADLNWQWSANHCADFAFFSTNGSITLNLLGGQNTALWESPNVLTRKIQCPSFAFHAQFDVTNLSAGDRSGILFIGGEYASVAVERDVAGYKLCYLESEDDPSDEEKRIERVVDRVSLPEDCDMSRILFTLSFTPDSDKTGASVFNVFAMRKKGSFSWQPHAAPYKTSNAHWVGARFGVYAVGSGAGKVIVSDIKEIPAGGYLFC